MIRLWMLSAFIFITCFNCGWAQCKQWNWPPDRKTCEENVVLLQDAVKAKDFVRARKPLQWLLKNTPTLQTSIYIYGATVYEGLYELTQDQELKQRYLDSLLLIYDLRSISCGETEKIINRKALILFRYTINGNDPEFVLNAMDEVLSMCGSRMTDATIVPYMESLVVTQLKTKKYSQEEILKRYNAISKIIEEKKTEGRSDKNRLDRLNEYKKQVDQLLLKVITFDCTSVHTVLKPMMEKSPEDTALARLIFSFLLREKCPPDELWLETGEIVFQSEKDFGLGKNLGVEFYVHGDTSKARAYFSECLSLAKNGKDSSDVFMYQGSLLVRSGQIVQARESFRSALRSDPARKEAYAKIGDLYYNSFESCARKINMADDRLVYLAAYDYYARAGDQIKMEMARKAFPSREEIFLLNYHSGDRMKVGCWINEWTVLRTRD